MGHIPTPLRFHHAREAWSRYQTDPAMSPSLAAFATGSAQEAHFRQAIADILRTGKPIRILGTDRITKSASTSMADGSATAVDTVIETADGAMRVRFRLDARGRVIGFAPYD